MAGSGRESAGGYLRAVAEQCATCSPNAPHVLPAVGRRGLMDMVERSCAAAGVPFEAEEFQDETLGKVRMIMMPWCHDHAFAVRSSS